MTALSDLPRLAAWSVPADEIDHIDHMGTAFYAYRVEGEAFRLVEALFGGGEGRSFRSLVQHYEAPEAIADGSGAELMAAADALPGIEVGFVDQLKTEVLRRWPLLSTETLGELADLEEYRSQFLRLFGFGIDGVDYARDVDPRVVD